MSVGRWKYKTAVVTVEDNAVTVRGLTAGERAEFLAHSKKVKAGEANAAETPNLVAKAGVVDPSLSDEELAGMPGQLLEAAVAKILELSGVKADDEKKDPTTH